MTQGHQDKLRELKFKIAETLSALEESVKLQSHYASLLNMDDGGERLVFRDAEDWIHRQRLLSRHRDEVLADTQRRRIAQGFGNDKLPDVDLKPIEKVTKHDIQATWADPDDWPERKPRGAP